MASRIGLTQQVKLLDEIIDNASGLPLESQDLLLMMAKAMKYTRDNMGVKKSDKRAMCENISVDGR